MQRYKVKEQDSVLNAIKDINDPYYENIDSQCFEKYNENNKHFWLNKLIFNNDEQEKQILAYHWIYQYEQYQIQLQYLLSNGIWKIIPDQFNLNEQDKLNLLLDDLHINRNLSLDQQIQLIIKRFDHHFNELNQEENIQQNQIFISSILKEDDDEIQIFNYRSNQPSINNHISTPSTILELDEEQTNLPLQSLTQDFQQNKNNLLPTSTPHRTRQDSSCSSTNSMKYVQFVPPSTTSICQRRVIQSILLHVQRKKILFEKVLDTLKHVPAEPTMYELGLEFLRIYDGKFNYPQGYTFVMSFKKRNWFLTIVNIKCVECQLGQSEPRSVLILKYHNQFTTVQV